MFQKLKIGVFEIGKLFDVFCFLIHLNLNEMSTISSALEISKFTKSKIDFQLYSLTWGYSRCLYEKKETPFIVYKNNIIKILN